MNVKNFREGVELMSHSGFSLTAMETSLIENSLIILQSDNKFEDIFFLGRIDTSGAERYYTAFGYSKDILKDRKFFYSLNGYEWLMMPTLKPKLLPIARNVKTFFRGDPAFVESVSMVKDFFQLFNYFSHIKPVFQPPNFIEDDQEVFLPCPRAIKKIKEEDRLSCFVHLMISESAIIPRGILYRQVNRCVTYNPCFRGLSRLDASLLKNFQLFRFPLNNRNYNLTKREDYNYQTDFFDTIDDLVPANCFSININNRDVCIVRSLKWPGTVFFHKLNTMYQGFFYFGNGRENLDLLFML